MGSLSCKGRIVFKRGILTSNIKYYSNHDDDYEDPTAIGTFSRELLEDHGKYFKKKNLL